MDLTEPGEEREEGAPYTDEEDGNEDEDLPDLEVGTPQEGPVPSVRLRKGQVRDQRGKRPIHTHCAQPILAQHQREEEPQHKLTTEKRVVEIGDLRWGLTVVLCIRG